MASQQFYTASALAKLLQDTEIPVSFEESQVCHGKKDAVQGQVQDGKERRQSHAVLLYPNANPLVHQCILALHDDNCKWARGERRKPR